MQQPTGESRRRLSLPQIIIVAPKNRPRFSERRFQEFHDGANAPPADPYRSSGNFETPEIGDSWLKYDICRLTHVIERLRDFFTTAISRASGHGV